MADCCDSLGTSCTSNYGMVWLACAFHRHRERLLSCPVLSFGLSCSPLLRALSIPRCRGGCFLCWCAPFFFFYYTHWLRCLFFKKPLQSNDKVTSMLGTDSLIFRWASCRSISLVDMTRVSVPRCRDIRFSVINVAKQLGMCSVNTFFS